MANLKEKYMEIKEIASINIFFNTLVRYPISITKLSLPLFYMLVL